MNWDAIVAIVQMLRALGVIFSVIYLAIQIRRGTAATRLSAALAQEKSIAEINLAIATS